MNKVIYVPAFFAPIMKEKKIKVRTGETTIGFFGGEKNITRKETKLEQIGWSDCQIDSERLANDLAKEVEHLNNDGFEVISIVPISSGAYESHYKMGTIDEGGYGYGYGYGFSYTSSLIVTAKLCVK